VNQKIKICLAVIAFSFFSVKNYVDAQNVIAVSDPSISTDTVISGDLVIGVNSNGGGVINFLEIPEIGNIFGPESVKYGRSGQSAMRDGMHGNRYNPTQAGFNETLGTPCSIEKGANKLFVPARPVALWYGDCSWDFTEWENIGPDPTCYPDGGNSDVDQLDESELEGKQNTEVKSEFDYFGLYHDYKNKGGIDISCIRHYFEYRYVREPGHCINQFRPGLDIFNAEQIHPDISTAFPVGTHTADPFDMSNFILSWHLRNDVANWDPTFQFLKSNDGTWTIQNREVYVKETVANDGSEVVPRLLIISDSSNPDTKNALGFYMPKTEFNNYETIGVDETTGLISYKDQRYKSIRIWDQPRRIPTMTVYGFKTETKGILNRTRLPQNIYEAYRFDMFILMGSPNEIWEAVNLIENQSSIWGFNENVEGWTSDSNNLVHENGSVKMNLNGELTLKSPDSLLIDTDLHKFINIRMKNNSPYTTVQFCFRKYNSSDWFFHTINVNPNSEEWQNYSFNISDHENWQDMIQQVEFKFPGSTGNIAIDLIAVSADGLSDCNGDFNGDAFLDACCNCVEGNTGVESCEDCMGIANGEAYLNNCGDCVGGTSTITETREWPFNVLSNWTLNPRISGYTNGGVANISISGNDPYMSYSGKVCIDTKSYKYLKLKLKNNTNGNVAALYYKNDLTDAWNFVSIPLSQSDSEFKNYTLDLTDEENWKGNVYAIRFDPPGNSGLIQLDYIGILTEGMLTSTNEIFGFSEENGVSVFPNPANKRFHVKANLKSKIVVYDSKGIEMFRSSQFKEMHTVETDDWNAGIYFVQVVNGRNVTHAKSLILN
jgi:hypothetical protein